MQKNERRTRAVKASLISVIAVAIAAVSHILAGGEVPTWFALIGATLVALPVTLGLTRPKLGVSGTFVSVAITQALFHWLFVFLGVRRTALSGEPLPAHAIHCGFIGEFVPFVPPEHSDSAGMFTTHLFATFITVWMLRRGEIALRRLARALTRVLWPAHIQLPTQHGRNTNHLPEPVILPRLSALFARCVTRRGPPAWFVPATINFSHP